MEKTHNETVSYCVLTRAIYTLHYKTDEFADSNQMSLLVLTEIASFVHDSMIG